jgi:two-component system response regulator TtrR
MMNAPNHPKPTPIVFVVEVDPGARQAIVWMLESAGGQVAAVESGENFLAAYRPEQTGCLILDMRLRGMTGLALQDELARCGITLPVIMMTGHAEVSAAVEALQRGAIDFIEKPVDGARLLERVETGCALDAERRRRERLRRACAERIERLTRREREVMTMVVAGKANKVVAYELGISPKTVESHRASVMSKLEVQSLADLVRLEWLAGHGELADHVGFRQTGAWEQTAP